MVFSMKNLIGITTALILIGGLFLSSCEKSSNDRVIVVSFDSLKVPSQGYWNGADNSGGFKVNGISFPNSYSKSDWGDYWGGFSYSIKHDIHTSGIINQFSSYALKDSGSSNTFVVAYPIAGYDQITFDNLVSGVRLKVCNTTYTALAMKYGDAYSKKFGGADSTVSDWFKLRIIGIDANGVPTDTAKVYLADYRFSGWKNDFIVNQWIEMDLSKLNEVKALKFILTSSDTGDFGMNTPGYFCLDDIEYNPVVVTK
jgi:hypothetical protein